MLTIILCTLLGYVIGLIQKGIHIHVHKPVDTVDKPKEYNESMAGYLPSEVQQYYQKTQGQNLF